MKINTRFWLHISILNFLIVALLGTIMRYKIGFEFPFFNQKNLQHAHSHFAFLGWITHTIYILILDAISKKTNQLNAKKYRRLIVLNLIFAYSMIISFIIGGYNVLSITISTLAIVLNYFFSYQLYKDITKSKLDNGAAKWLKVALIFNILSSIGTFALAYMLGTKQFNQHWYLASLYFYLHFQYNGFFTFACIGLLLCKLSQWLPAYEYKASSFWFLFLACIPAYFLSTLWAGLPMWLYSIVIMAAIAQLIGWMQLLKTIFEALPSKTEIFKKGYYIFLLVAIAYTIKLFLQLGSTIPVVSKLAFGFRPIVIAYLHLILLAIISVFLLGYMYTLNYISNNKTSKWAMIALIACVYLNELVLGIQGIASFSYIQIPLVNVILFIIALAILFGNALLYLSQNKSEHSLVIK